MRRITSGESQAIGTFEHIPGKVNRMGKIREDIIWGAASIVLSAALVCLSFTLNHTPLRHKFIYGIVVGAYLLFFVFPLRNLYKQGLLTNCILMACGIVMVSSELSCIKTSLLTPEATSGLSIFLWIAGTRRNAHSVFAMICGVTVALCTVFVSCWPSATQSLSEIMSTTAMIISLYLLFISINAKQAC